MTSLAERWFEPAFVATVARRWFERGAPSGVPNLPRRLATAATYEAPNWTHSIMKSVHEETAADAVDFDAPASSKSQRKIKLWLVDYLAELLDLPKDEINTTVEFERLGLDSSSAVAMTGDLEDWLGVRIDTTAAYDFSTVEKLAEYLAGLSADQAGSETTHQASGN